MTPRPPRRTRRPGVACPAPRRTLACDPHAAGGRLPDVPVTRRHALPALARLVARAATTAPNPPNPASGSSVLAGLLEQAVTWHLATLADPAAMQESSEGRERFGVRVSTLAHAVALVASRPGGVVFAGRHWHAETARGCGGGC